MYGWDPGATVVSFNYYKFSPGEKLSHWKKLGQILIPPPAQGIPAVVATDPTCPFPRKLSLEPSLLSAVRYACGCGNLSLFFRLSGAAKVNDGKMA